MKCSGRWVAGMMAHNRIGSKSISSSTDLKDWGRQGSQQRMSITLIMRPSRSISVARAVSPPEEGHLHRLWRNNLYAASQDLIREEWVSHRDQRRIWISTLSTNEASHPNLSISSTHFTSQWWKLNTWKSTKKCSPTSTFTNFRLAQNKS